MKSAVSPAKYVQLRRLCCSIHTLRIMVTLVTCVGVGEEEHGSLSNVRHTHVTT